jgi:predicted MFS family arabinose efflux permease
MPDAVASLERSPLMTRGFSTLLVTQACFGYAFSSFFLLPKYLVVALGAGPAQVGLVTGVHGLAVVLFLPAMGAAVDRLGRRNFLTAGALLMAVACFAYAFVEAVGPLIYGLRVVQGLAFSMAFAAGAALAVDEAPRDRVGQAIGIFGLTFLSMNAVAPAVVEELAERASWATAFAASGGGALLCAVLSRRLKERRLEPDGDGAVPGLWAVASRPSQLRVMLVIALVGAAMCAVFVFHQPYAIELGMPRLRSFFFSYAAVAIIVRVGFGHLMDQWGLRRVSILALVLYVGVVLSVVDLERFGLVAIGMGLGLAHGVFYPAFNAVAVERVGPHERGKAMALFQAAFNVGFSGGAFALGLLAARAGYPAVFETAAACVLAALLLLIASPEGRAQGRLPAAP